MGGISVTELTMRFMKLNATVRFSLLVLALILVSPVPLLAADLDQDGIDDAYEDVLMHRFAPIYHLFPINKLANIDGDPYQPSSVDWYLDRCRLLVNGTTVLSTGQVNQASMLIYAPLAAVANANVRLDHDNESDSTLRYGNLSTNGMFPRKCYAHVRHENVGTPSDNQPAYYITYIFFFPFSGDGNGDIGHECDLEHFTVCVAEDGRTVIRVLFDAHGSLEASHWLGPEEVHYQPGTTRVHAYSGSNSHATYPFAVVDTEPLAARFGIAATFLPMTIRPREVSRGIPVRTSSIWGRKLIP